VSKNPRTRNRRRAAWAAVLAATMVAALCTLTGTGVAGATAVGDETALRTAFADATETSIVLTADVTLTCGGGGVASRTSDTSITIDGQGFTITQECVDAVMLEASGAGGVSLRDITLTGGAAGLVAEGPADVRDSRIAGLVSTADDAVGVLGAAGVTVTDSVIEDVEGGDTAYAVIATGGTIAAHGVRIRGFGSVNGSIGLLGDDITAVDTVATDLSSTAVAVGFVGQTLTVAGSTVQSLSGDDEAYGVYALEALTMSDSYVAGLAGRATIGVLAPSGATVTRSTITGLSGTELGFGVLAGPDLGLRLVNTTIADVAGPALISTGETTIVYSTIRGTGGPITFVTGLSGAASEIALPADGELSPQIKAEGPLTMFGTVVVQGRLGAANCGPEATPTSAGYNFADDDSCGLTAEGDRQGAGLVAGLGALGDHGGPGPTMVPDEGSLLLDAIPAAACQLGPAAGVTTDERGEPRPALGGCDIGAVEVQPPPEPTFTG